MLPTHGDGGISERFQQDGYVAIQQFASNEELTAIETHLRRFIDQVVPRLPREDVFYEDKGNATTLKQVQRMHQHDDFFHHLMTDSPFCRVAEELLDDDVVPKNLQYFNKPPGVGQPTPPHQDGYYFMLDPCEAVTMWFALDQVDEENGCVRYIPGSHKEGMRPHGRTETLGFSQGIIDYGDCGDTEREVFMHATPGDLLVHHALTIHLAGGNHSTTRQRRSLGFIYYAARAKVDEAAHRAYQEKLKNEMAEAGKI